VNGATSISWTSNGTWLTSDYNDLYDTSGYIVGYSGTYYTLNTWKASTRSPDAHSIGGNPNLSSTYHLQSGSPAIAAGTNLYGTCFGQPNPGLGALCFDKDGIARPSTGAWDIGAYQYSGIQNVSNSPTGLNALVR
jgi:hypothetical protein